MTGETLEVVSSPAAIPCVFSDKKHSFHSVIITQTCRFAFAHSIRQMYFHPNPFIYLTFFNEEIIALDLRDDQYLIFPQSIAESLYNALRFEFEEKNGSYSFLDGKDNPLPDDFDEAVSYLQESGILSDKLFDVPYPNILIKNGESAGAPNIDWRISGDTLSKKVPLLVIAEIGRAHV